MPSEGCEEIVDVSLPEALVEEGARLHGLAPCEEPSASEPSTARAIAEGAWHEMERGVLCRSARRAQLAAGTQGERKGGLRATRQALGSWRQKIPHTRTGLHGSMPPHSALVHCAA